MSDVVLDIYEPVEPFVLHDLDIPTADNSRWVLQFTPVGAVPHTGWWDLIDEIQDVYIQRKDYQRAPNFEAWLARLQHALNESDTILVMKQADSREVLAAASGFVGDNLHYGESLMYTTILNPTQDRKGMYKALREAAVRIGVQAWCRSKFIKDGRFEVTFREV